MSEAMRAMFARFKNPRDKPLFRNHNNDWVEQAFIAGYEAAMERAAEIAESANGLTQERRGSAWYPHEGV